MAVEWCMMNRGARIVCIREVQKSLKESVKRLIEDKIDALGLGHEFDCQSDQIITPGGGVILFQGMQDHTKESIKSLEGFHVAYVEEAQTLSEGSLEMLRPTIRAPGSELWFSWNPRSKNDPVDALLRGKKPPEGAIVVRANYDKNPFFPKELEMERRDDLERKPERYPHIWEGDYEPAAIGAYYANEMAQLQRNNRITSVPHVPGVQVETWWDLGARKQGRTMAVGFVQRVGHELRAIDFITDDGPDRGLPWFAKRFQEKQAEHGYVYGKEVWPHDGAHIQKATGKTLADTWHELTHRRPEIVNIEAVGVGIEAVRNLLPLMWFDAEKCEGWVEALKNYRQDFDDKLNTFKGQPRHDWASHPADMTRVGAMYVPVNDWSKPLKYDTRGYV
jgi:phage terminase large subunit